MNFGGQILLAFVVAFALVDVAFGQGHVTNSKGAITKCAKCYYMTEGAANLFGGTPGSPKTPGQNPRCAFWDDNIPESQYETCSEPNEGEANACVYFNMTFTMKNALTDGLAVIGGIGGAVGGIVNNATGTIGNVIGGNIGSSIGNVGSAIGNVGGSFGGFGKRRRKRQIRAPIPIQPPSFNVPLFSASDGTYTIKMFYKGCVKLSLLETLVGSNCRLEPDLDDIRFFSQQALLQPVMDVVEFLEGGWSAMSGIKHKVDGLCYWQTKELQKKIWKGLLHYEFPIPK